MNNIHIDLNKYPLKPNLKYTFDYKNKRYNGEFVLKKNKISIPPQTVFMFKEFTLSNNKYKPLKVLNLFEYDTYFSDSESDANSDSDTSVSERASESFASTFSDALSMDSDVTSCDINLNMDLNIDDEKDYEMVRIDEMCDNYVYIFN
jgi:hypothetical protein